MGHEAGDSIYIASYCKIGTELDSFGLLLLDHILIKTHDSESRGQEEAQQRDH